MHVVAVDDPMIDVSLLREQLGPAATVETATADLSTAVAEATALVTDVNTPVTAELLDTAEDLRVVARAGVGVDNVDVAAATDREIVVTNVPDYCTGEVATHTVSLLLACVRRVTEYDRAVRSGSWGWDAVDSLHRVAGSTIGFVSFGPIARRVTERVNGFDLDPIAYDPYVEDDVLSEYGVASVSFETLLDRAELIVVLAPLTDETRGLFDETAFDRMRDHAVLVNTGRGGIVREESLAAALRDGELAAAGLDVFETEPLEASPLFDRDDVVLTPHAGWYSVEARETLNRSVAKNVRAVLDCEEPPDRVDPDLDWA